MSNDQSEQGLDLFGQVPRSTPRPATRSSSRPVSVGPASLHPSIETLAASLPENLHLGTSSWNFPGWKNLVWDDEYAEAALSKNGLSAYARHPLLRTVSLDRNFYRPLSASQYAAYAAQVPGDFRFVLKAPSLITDAVLRAPDGRGTEANPSFLDADRAIGDYVQPALDGLGDKLGVLVFQISPLSQRWLGRMPELLDRMHALLWAIKAPLGSGSAAIAAVEVRDAQFLTPAFAQALKAAGATYCLGLHARMPPIGQQLPVLRALWPGPTVCRWNLHRIHGPHGYEDARTLYAPFDALVDEDPETRRALSAIVAGTTAAGHAAYVTVNNKAEGSAPLSVVELARAVASRLVQADFVDSKTTSGTGIRMPKSNSPIPLS